MSALLKEETNNHDASLETRAAASQYTRYQKVNHESALKAGLELLNAAISALEATAWQGREIVEEARQRLREFDQDKDNAIEELGTLAGKAKRIPIRLKRMVKTAFSLSLITGSYRLWGTRAAFLSAEKQEIALDKLHRKNAARFRQAALEHGGAFLKVGQLISARADLMPASWIDELKVLQDQALPVSFREVKESIEHELQKPIADVFAEFIGEPIAAASIGQVHEARLHNGQRVAVKVQRPGIEEVIEQDMALMKVFLDALKPVLPPTDLETISAEIERTVKAETRYRQECRWMQKLGDFLGEHSAVQVPKPVAHLCSDRLLVTEFVDGVKLTDRLDALKAEGDDQAIAEILGQLLEAYVLQVLQAGLFQADPHPGNILVTPNNTLVLLDFGCTMELTEKFRTAYREILMAALLGNRDVMAKGLMDLGFETRSGKADTLLSFADALLDNIKNAASQFSDSNSTMHWPEGDEIFAEAAALLRQAEHDPVIRIPAEFVMLARVFSTLGGLFTYYKPSLDVNKYLLPHLQLQ